MKKNKKFSKSIKNIFGYPLLIASLLFVNGTGKNFKNKENFGKREIISKNLKLNDNDSLSFITNKSEIKGIKDIRKISESYASEECWVYFPEDKVWYETGIKRSMARDSSGNMVSRVEQDYDFLKKLIKEKDMNEIIVYHNHPTLENMIESVKKIKPISTSEYEKIIGYSISDSKDNLKNSGDSLNYQITREVLKDAFYSNGFAVAKPSVSDLKLMVYESLIFKNKNVLNKICSEKGITEFYLTQKGINHYDSLGIGNYDDFLKNTYKYFSSKDFVSIENNKMIINFKTFKDLRESKTKD